MIADVWSKRDFFAAGVILVAIAIVGPGQLLGFASSYAERIFGPEASDTTKATG